MNLTTDLTISDEIDTSKTYKIEKDKIQGSIDNLEALQQAIYKGLSTEKYEYPIYSFSYGIELDDLIGKDSVYVKAELKRRMQECLLKDERILNVDSFIFSLSGDALICSCNVTSIFGQLSIVKEVII